MASLNKFSQKDLDKLVQKLEKYKGDLEKADSILTEVENRYEDLKEKEIKKRFKEEGFKETIYEDYYFAANDVLDKLKEAKKEIHEFKDTIVEKEEKIDFTRFPRYKNVFMKLILMLEKKVPDVLDLANSALLEMRRETGPLIETLTINKKPLFEREVKLEKEKREKKVEEEAKRQELKEKTRKDLDTSIEEFKKKESFQKFSIFSFYSLIWKLSSLVKDLLIDSELTFENV